MSDGLNQDHPGYTDKEYKKRRDSLVHFCKDYKMLDDINYVKY